MLAVSVDEDKIIVFATTSCNYGVSCRDESVSGILMGMGSTTLCFVEIGNGIEMVWNENTTFPISSSQKANKPIYVVGNKTGICKKWPNLGGMHTDSAFLLLILVFACFR